MAEKSSLIPMAICYDFDGTLIPGNLHEYGFIDSLGMQPAEFWALCGQLARDCKADGISTYMKKMKEERENRGLSFTKQDMWDYAAKATLFVGVDEWFTRMNAYALSKGVALEHYIVSSGVKEMIEGTVIAKHFKEVFASAFLYDETDTAVWPALVVNYTNKTQFLYRINKGCLDVSDNESINRRMDDADKPMPFAHFIYIGDGETDIPSMKTVKREGGHTIAVYNPHVTGQREKVKGLLGIERADVIAPADYRENQPIDLFVKGVIDKIIADVQLKKIQEKLNK